MFVYFTFWLHHRACRILVPQPGIEPAPPAVQVQSLNPWTAREVPPIVKIPFVAGVPQPPSAVPPEPSPTPVWGKHCLPRNRSLVPKRLGTAALLRRISFLRWVSFASLLQISWPYLYGFISGLPSVPLIFVSVLLPVPHCLEYCIFYSKSLEWCKFSNFDLAILGSFAFPFYIILLSMSVWTHRLLFYYFMALWIIILLLSFILLLRLSQIWPMGDRFHRSLNTFLPPGITKYSRVSCTFPVLALESAIFPGRPSFFYCRMAFRDQRLGAKCAHFLLGCHCI